MICVLALLWQAWLLAVAHMLDEVADAYYRPAPAG